MNNQLINKTLKYIIITCIAIIPFIPLYVANNLFFPFITGKAFAFRILVEIAFALWLILILREKGTTVSGTEKSVAPRINSLTILVTAFTLITLLADLVGLNPIRSIWSNFERMEGWLTIVHLWAYFIVLSSVFSTDFKKDDGVHKSWHKFIDVILVAGGIVAVYGLFQFFGWAEIHQGANRVDASLGNSAYMAVYMLINAFLAWYMAFSVGIKNKGKNALVWVYIVMGAVFSFVMFQTATRGTILGWIGAILLACFIYAVFGRRKSGQTNKSRILAGGVILIFVLSGFLFWINKDAEWIQGNKVLGRLATISISDTKTQARGFIWPMAVKSVFEDPKTAIIGVGQENFNYIFNSNYDPLMYSHEQWFDRAHSVFLDWLVAGGLLGLIFYLSLYIISLIYIIKSKLSLSQKSVLIGLLAGYAVHNIFVFDNQTSYVMFFTILALVHSFREGKIPKWLDTRGKKMSEDAETVINYIFVPITVIAFVVVFYFVNIRTINANIGLLSSLKACSDGKTVSVEPFKKALGNPTADQEVREQLYSCAANVISSNLSDDIKVMFYDFVKEETQRQINATPNDARIYIIAGGFYNHIKDWDSARPLLEKAMQLSPRKQSIAMEVAVNYLNSGRTQEAVDLMEETWKSAPENREAQIAYTVSLIANGEKEEAEYLFGSDTEIFTDSRVINAYVSIKDYSKIISIYRELLATQQEDPQIYSGLASAYLMSGNNALAISTLETASLKFPLLKTEIDAIIKDIREGKNPLQN